MINSLSKTMSVSDHTVAVSKSRTRPRAEILGHAYSGTSLHQRDQTVKPSNIPTKFLRIFARCRKRFKKTSNHDAVEAECSYYVSFCCWCKNASPPKMPLISHHQGKMEFNLLFSIPYRQKLQNVTFNMNNHLDV